MFINGYRSMWVLAMFDLPTDTKQARHDYARFRKSLIKDGFSLMQYSVYVRHCSSEENALVHVKRVELNIPPHGEVRVLAITDKQFERMHVFWGKKRKPVEPPPQQLELF